jgi:hypothetical protein
VHIGSLPKQAFEIETIAKRALVHFPLPGRF